MVIYRVLEKLHLVHSFGSGLLAYIFTAVAVIGKHCVIGANSVVTKDVPDYCVAVGSPARVIKKM